MHLCVSHCATEISGTSKLQGYLAIVRQCPTPTFSPSCIFDFPSPASSLCIYCHRHVQLVTPLNSPHFLIGCRLQSLCSHQALHRLIPALDPHDTRHRINFNFRAIISSNSGPRVASARSVSDSSRFAFPQISRIF